MGAYAPMSSLALDEVDDIMERIVAPTVRELTRRDIDYRGVLYAGIMLTPDGPKILEYNARFGDPETQVLVPLYGDALYDLLLSVAEGRLVGPPLSAEGAAVTVILASHGYPESPRRGDVITGLGVDGQLARALEGVTIFHAGTAIDADGHRGWTSARRDRGRRDASRGAPSRL
jgi:phosphoribosylamine--glycine ligase